MISGWAVALALPAIFIAVVDWRKGLFALLVVAFLQDPVRKLVPDQPVYFTLLVGAVFVVVYGRAQTSGLFRPSQIPGWKRYLRTPFTLFLLLLVVQFVISIARYGNLVMAGIGALSYLAPLPAMLVGYHFAVKVGRDGVQRWLTCYLVVAMIFVSSILLEFAGVEWETLGQVGGVLDIYQDDAILTSHSGFFRASETAAWHTATVVCFLLLMSSMRKLRTWQIILAVTVVIALLGIGVLTGRRKIFVEIVIFMSGYVSLLLLFGKGGLRVSIATFMSGLLCYGLVTWWVEDARPLLETPNAAGYEYYAGRTASVQYGIQDRAYQTGLESVKWALATFGWLGGGLGLASQGAQHFGGGAEVYGGAGEGGLGKIAVELGAPGLLIGTWLGTATLLMGWYVLVFVSRRSAAVARLAYGLVAFLIANFAVFFVATQVFGDLFVLLLLGLVLGFFLATPVLAEREGARAATRVRPVAVPRAGMANR